MDWINPLYMYLGLGGFSIAAAVAVAIYFPPFRKIAIMVAGGIAAVLYAYAQGSRDATKRKQKEWDDANKRDVAKGRKARTDAERDVAAGRVRGGKWDRDKGGV